MGDEPQQQTLPLAETPPAPEQPKPPKPPPPSRAERQERARELVAEQRLEALQTQIQGLQGQLGAVGQHLMQTQNAQWQARLAEMSPAERAEAQSQAALQQVQNLTNALQNQQPRGQPQESPEQRYERRSRELEQEYGIARDDWPPGYVKAGEEATLVWLGEEARRREAEAAAAAVAPPAATEPSYAASSGRASAPPPVQDSDYQRIAWDGVSRQKGGAGRSYGVQGRSQAKVVAQLTELRNQAYREAGIG